MPRILTIPLIAAALALPGVASYAATSAQQAPLTIPLLKPGTDRAAQGIPPQEPPGASPVVAARHIAPKAVQKSVP